MSDPITSDPIALRDYLVRLAMEAARERGIGIPDDLLALRFRERMAQAAQAIVCEVESAANDRPLAGELTLRQTEAWLASRGLCALSPVHVEGRWTVTALIDVGPCLSVFSANGGPVVGEGRDLQDAVTNLMSRVDAARAA